MYVKLWMVEDPVTIGPEATLAEAVELFRQHGIRRLPVVSKDTLVGILGRRDLEGALPSSLEAKDEGEEVFVAEHTEVRAVMISPVISIGPNETLVDAVKKMRKNKIDGLPVVADGRLVGLVSITDILDAFLEIMETKGGGMRLDLRLGNQPEALYEMIETMSDHDREIVAIFQHHGYSRDHQLVTVQVRGRDQQELIDGLWSAGIQVEQVTAVL